MQKFHQIYQVHVFYKLSDILDHMPGIFCFKLLRVRRMNKQASLNDLGHRLFLPLLAACALSLSGCSTTDKVAVTHTSGFLGKDASRLTPLNKGDDTASLRYVNPAAQWTQYQKVIIDPVTFWGGETTKLSAADQQTLVNFFSQQLNEALKKKFEVVTQPGPGTLKLSVALTDAEAATPGLRSVSMLIPQAHLISNLKYLATGSLPFVGAAQVEGKITDAVTGQLLAAAVDRRIGGGAMSTAFQWEWGDAENAITRWSEMTAGRLYSWVSGQAKP
jgi:hypothetical protein